MKGQVQNSTSIPGWKIILRGYLQVVVPSALVFLGTMIAIYYFEVPLHIVVVGGGLVAWRFWLWSIKGWKKWASRKGISQERLFKWSRKGLICFYRHQIVDLYSKEHEQNN
ncbi:hypothetical protein KFE98_16425 [bacterium SCSIO 12741]|nr:hypothetical protein KFE98_16425 [bacterium SCSIO 12741]